jgi:uncharacterized membrane protein YhaH (DUF805 family)
MTFMESVRAVLTNYVGFTGRARRSEYWWFFLFSFIVNVVATIIDSALGLQLVTVIASLALLLPSLAVAVRRLHDLDKSGWFLLLAFIPLVGILILIYWFVQEGTKGDNRFGRAPA